MLQPTVWTQLARIKHERILGSIRTIIRVNHLPPLSVIMHQAGNTVSQLKPSAKHFYMGGTRCFGVAVKLILEGKIIAIPTDTVYGLATLAQNTQSVKKLYELKGRDANKPVAICLSCVKEIKHWAELDHLPPPLIVSLLPGPVTVVLKRKPKLNANLNPGIDTVGIRVPQSKFIRTLCQAVGQPIALTSANSSGDQSSFHPDEFTHLWRDLGGIFYSNPDKQKTKECRRVGSTIVDLSEQSKYKIIREGIGYENTLRLLHKYGLQKRDE
ncbi:yrdC domain-containing protein, mitochondrial [Chelonus insularis]|uniref:yrdC domain-containing protein, mitochondrial n=1 Tax=Chelonus insularis TaxID=460826 RepID=UPI00158C0AAD|nr:yrdC domain-containing protein, mitochondrial [Chelonus insularis]